MPPEPNRSFRTPNPWAANIEEDDYVPPPTKESPQVGEGVPTIKINYLDANLVYSLGAKLAAYKKKYEEYGDMPLEEAIKIMDFKKALYNMIIMQRLHDKNIIQYEDVRKSVQDQYGEVDEALLTEAYMLAMEFSMGKYKEE